MANNFVHCELSTSDVGKAAGFYKKLFDWKVSEMPGMDYQMVDTGSKISGGGIQKLPMPDAPTAWMPYVEVADVKKSIAKAEKLGAKIIHPFQEVGKGAIGIFCDPTGAYLGVYQAAAKKPAAKTKPAAKKKK